MPQNKILHSAILICLILIFNFVSVMCALCEEMIIFVGYIHKDPGKLNQRKDFLPIMIVVQRLRMLLPP